MVLSLNTFSCERVGASMIFLSHFLKHKRSGAIAKVRLKSMLMSDRSECSSDIIDAIKEELYETLARYIEVDMGHIQLDMITNDEPDTKNKQIFLVAKIPFRGINKVIC